MQKHRSKSRWYLAAMLIVPALGAGSLPGRAEKFGPELPAAGPSLGTAVAAKSLSGSLELVVGDRLKIRFMEHVDVPAEPGGEGRAPQPAMSTFLERTDLSDEYEVQFDGNISLPRIGAVKAGGQTADQLKVDLAKAFKDVTGRTCDIVVSISDRPPVYVNGPLRSPGSFKHVPGMLAMHALALAGGLDRNSDRQSRAIDEVREREKWQQANQRLQRLIAQKARVEADAVGLSEIEAPEELQRIASNPEAKRLMRSENRKLALSQKLHASKMKTLQRAIREAEREVRVLEERNEQLARLVKVRADRYKGIEGVASRGNASKTTVLAAGAELVDAETRVQDGKLAIIQASQKISEAERALQDYEMERKSGLEIESQRLDEDILEAHANVSALRGVLGIMNEGNGLAVVKANRSQFSFEIVRRGTDGPVRIQVDEMTELKPGDLVLIEVAPQLNVPTAAGPIDTGSILAQ